MKHGYEILSDPFLNKGTAFTMEERERLGLVGLLPPHVQTIEEQADQAYKAYSAQESDVARRHYLMDVFSRNRTLFYYLFSQHVEEFMPIVYDPTIAQDIEEYGKAYLEPQHAVYLSIDRDDDIEDVLRPRPSLLVAPRGTPLADPPPPPIRDASPSRSRELLRATGAARPRPRTMVGYTSVHHFRGRTQ
ncbi:hypothetical protein [Collinsella vaginalis]|uniref:hypothetical protein n=1 Tax=Collinsella vaginalis TaxID=1870987 RepID=UPI000A268A22|nr:hypothetical protein [Collinsella vaginalis]